MKEVFKKMALLGAQLQLPVELIADIEHVQPLYKAVLKNKCNNARLEIDKALNQLISNDEKVQIEALQLATKLEQSYKSVYEEFYKWNDQQHKNFTTQ